MSTEIETSRAKRVLLIDDDPLQLRVRQAVLHEAGIPVDVAPTAESALAFLRSTTGDEVGTIVTDHVMPGVSGAVFVRKLREVRPGIPVIVISGMAEAEDEYEGLNVRFRTKPCPPPELIGMVKQTLLRNS